jgi:hypothetical protein
MATQMIDEGLLGGESQSGVYPDREVKEFIAHPDELKRLAAGRALLIRGTDECAVIQVDYQPTETKSEFAPTRPRIWREGDRKRLGLERAALGVRALVEKKKAQRKGELANRNQPQLTEAIAPRADAGFVPPDPSSEGVVRNQLTSTPSETKTELTSELPKDKS